jgi:hypothetical protein
LQEIEREKEMTLPENRKQEHQQKFEAGRRVNLALTYPGSLYAGSLELEITFTVASF